MRIASILAILLAFVALVLFIGAASAGIGLSPGLALAQRLA